MSMMSPSSQRKSVAGSAKLRCAAPTIHRSIALMVLFHVSAPLAAPPTLPSKKATNSAPPMANQAKSEDICSAAANIIATSQKESTNGQSLLNRLIQLNQSISTTPQTTLGQDAAAISQTTQLAEAAAKDLGVFLGFFSLSAAEQIVVQKCAESRAVPKVAGAREVWPQIFSYRLKLEVELDLILNPPKNKQWLKSADKNMIAQLKNLLSILGKLNQANAKVKDQPYSCDEPM
jgi:hypothetical protein